MSKIKRILLYCKNVLKYMFQHNVYLVIDMSGLRSTKGFATYREAYKDWGNNACWNCIQKGRKWDCGHVWESFIDIIPTKEYLTYNINVLKEVEDVLNWVEYILPIEELANFRELKYKVICPMYNKELGDSLV